MERFTGSGDYKGVVMSRDEVRAVDAWAINELGVAGVVLMENAGRACSEVVVARLEGVDKPRVCVFCGVGNNGGDGYVIARHLANIGVGVYVVICGEREKIKGDALVNLEIIEKMGMGIEVMDMEGDIAGQVKRYAADCDLLVDSLFGTGLGGELRGKYVELIDSINNTGIDIVAVDIPSGLDCDSGTPLGTAIRAVATVTFVAVKKGFLNPDSAAYTGEVYVASIGVDAGLKR